MAYGDRDELIKRYGADMIRWRNSGKSYREIRDLIVDDYGHNVSVEKLRQLYHGMIEDHRRAAKDKGPIGPWVNVTGLEDVDEPIEDLIARRVKHTTRSRQREARREFCASFDSDPWGLFLIGDPHLDNPGTRWDLLMRHVGAVRRSDAPIYAVNLGDSQDHWVGRLAAIYSSSPTTAAEGWRLARWLMGNREGEDACLRHLALVGGNHDSWSRTHGLDPYAEICRWAGIEFYDDCEVRIRITYKDAPDMVLLLRHDLPGRSWFHPTHGPAKEAMLDPDVDLVACGHLHQWGSLQQEHRGGRTPIALRVRGYKEADHYAREKGFHPNHHGHSCLVVIDPKISGPGRLVPFWDIDAGIAYLEQLQKKDRTDR